MLDSRTQVIYRSEWTYRFVDILVAIPLAILFTPIILVLCIPTAFAIDSKVFFTQKRVGQYGREILFTKIRSIKVFSTVDLIAEHDHTYYQNMYEMIPRWGEFMRRFSLDELPQIFLVVMGRMSLVGPRPILENEVAQYGEAFVTVFSIKPGLTGYWQISGRKNLSWEDRVNLDLVYLENRSLMENLKICLRTIPAVLVGRGAY